MKLFNLPLIALLCLFSGCATNTASRQASIKILAPPAGMYLMVRVDSDESFEMHPGDDNFEMHPGDDNWEITREPVSVTVTPVLAEGQIILGKSDILHAPTEVVKNQGSCNIRGAYTATVDVVDYQKVVCSENHKVVVQKGDTASSVIISFNSK